jgi:ABC-2 type transport system permease protein
VVLLVLVKREIKAFLKNPAFILSIVVLIAFYGAIGGMTAKGVQQAAEAVLAMRLGVVLEEDTALTRKVVELLNETAGGRVEVYRNLEEAVEKAGVGIVLARGFTENATTPGAPVFIYGSVRADTVSQIEIQARASLLPSISGVLKGVISRAVKEVYGVEVYKDKPVVVSGTMIFYGREVSPDALLGFLTLVTMLSLLIGIVTGSTTGYAAQLVAMEKVEKAFEMLLSQPIKRSRVVLAKIIGASVASLIFSAAYLAGLLGVVAWIAASAPGQGAGGVGSNVAEVLCWASSALGFDVAQSILVSIAVALPLGLYSSGALGIVLGSLSSDERSASILITPVTMVYFGLALAFFFVGLEPSLELAVVSGLLVVPMPALYVLSLVTGRPLYGLVSVATAVAFSAALTLIATHLFNRDIVILGVRLKLRRKAG